MKPQWPFRDDDRDPLVAVLNERAAQLVKENAILRAAFEQVVEDNDRLRQVISEGRCARCGTSSWPSQ